MSDPQVGTSTFNVGGAGRVVDAHAHFWRRPARGEVLESPVADPAVSPEDLVATARSAGVDQVIHVTRGVTGYDNRQSIEGARGHPSRLAVLCRFDPRLPEIRQRLVSLIKTPGVLGIRVFDPPPYDRWLTDGTLEPVWQACVELNVPVAIYAPNAAAILRETARRHPTLTIVADHLALNVFEGVSPVDRLAGWKDLISLHVLPNVVLKASGLPQVTEERFPFPKAQQLAREVYEIFGADRMMWGSNYPPILRTCSYHEAIEFVRSACDFIAGGDKEAILGGTAIRVFGRRWHNR